MENTIKSKIVTFPNSAELRIENDRHSSVKSDSKSSIIPFRNSLFGGLLSRSQGVKERFANGVRIIIEKGEKEDQERNGNICRFVEPILSIKEFKDLIEWFKWCWIKDIDVRLANNGEAITDDNLDWVIWQSAFLFSKEAESLLKDHHICAVVRG